jgi:ATP-dependent exoDNAse (exonuclease V) beta subunit
MCAIRLAGCAPHDLLEHEAEELSREQAEGMRVAYVAATRARDLLVIPAVGDEEREGWVQPLNLAIYPPVEARQQQVQPPGCVAFKSKDSVLVRPGGSAAGRDTVSPGVHVVKPEGSGAALDGHAPRVQADTGASAEFSVVWWDPRALKLGAEAPLGIRRPELIVKDVKPEIVEAGLAAYDTWRKRREQALDVGAQASLTVRTVTEAAKAKEEPTADWHPPDVKAVELPRAADRPSGRRFGSLVHAVLASVPLDGDPEAPLKLAAIHGRILGAPQDEVDHAAEAARTALAHPIFVEARHAASRGRCRREVPIAWRDGDGSVIEGVVDLAFEQAQGWTVIDFKTDEEFRENEAAYRRQVAIYAAAIHAANGAPVSPILMRV